ncbi:MAG: glycosyltransferase family 9 protein [Candidatus Edwardsbacteria bacterium]|jgi:ADP-heptose:LPS heptosyltransferase|nr:glycosyltransferase family 9 protein [Candidatus Edwardsbacteria bacterium]
MPATGLRQRHSRRYPHRLSTAMALSLVDAVGSACRRSGLIRHRRLRLPPCPSFLVIRNDHIGDVVLATPVTGALRERFPGCRITWLVQPDAAPLLRADERICEVLTMVPPWFDRYGTGRLDAVRRVWSAVRALRRRRFDAVIELRGDIRNIIWLGRCATSAPVISYQDATAGRGWVDYPHLYADGPEIASNLRLLEPLGIEIKMQSPVLCWTKAMTTAVVAVLKSQGVDPVRPLIVVHPGSGAPWRYRRWPVERFNALCRAIEREYEVQLVVTGSASEADLAQQAAQGLKRATVLAGRLRIEQIPILLSMSRLLVSNDTATVHMAAATGTPAVVLWGPGDRRKFAHSVRTMRIVSADPSCSPCPHGMCHRPDDWCLGRITIDEVLDRTRAVLGKPERR